MRFFMTKVKEIQVTFRIKGMHTQNVIVPANTDLDQLRDDLEKDIAHTTTTGKSIISKIEGEIAKIGTITSHEPQTTYHEFKVNKI
jgi:hypothetical protein